jgi:hypothetical protein
MYYLTLNVYDSAVHFEFFPIFFYCLHFAKFVCLLCHNSQVAIIPPPPPTTPAPQDYRMRRSGRSLFDEEFCLCCWLYINIITCKGFEECVRVETAHLATLKSKSTQVDNLFKKTAGIESGMGEKSSWDQANRRQNLVLFGELKRISQIIKDVFYLPFSLLNILWGIVTWAVAQLTLTTCH